MKMPEYKEKCGEEFLKNHPGEQSSRNTVNLRCAVARDLFEGEPQEVKDAVHTAGEEWHAAELEKYNSVIRGEASQDPDEQRK